jgi:ribosomal protein S27AE
MKLVNIFRLFDAVSPMGRRDAELPKEYITCPHCGASSMPEDFPKGKCPNCGKNVK